MTRRTILLVSLALLIGLIGRAQPRPALHQVHKIHVAAMGAGAEADRFHHLLEDQFRKVGFEIFGSAAEAQADLSGEFSTETHGDFSSAHANLLLKSLDGKRILWSGDYVSQHKGSTAEDVVQTLAQTCAERFRQYWEKN